MQTRDDRDLTLLDLIANGTMDAATAATLSAIGQERRSFLAVAIPGWAGKSTTAAAIVQCAPDGTPLHAITGDPRQLQALATQPQGGYLLVGELSTHGMPGYLWGAAARRLFVTLRSGYALATTQHAPSAEDAIRALCQDAGVPDADVAQVSHVVYIHVSAQGRGRSVQPRRRVAQVYEVDGVTAGEPAGRVLHRWLPEADAFERGAASAVLRTRAALLAARALRFSALATAGRTSLTDLWAALAASSDFA